MSRPVWTWEMLGADEEQLDRPLSPTFTNRFDAEAWLGENWRTLATDGVGSVRLRYRDEPVAAAIPLRRD